MFENAFWKFKYDEKDIRKEEGREKIRSIVWFFLFLYFIFATWNIKNPLILEGLMKVLIGANVALLLALVIKDFKYKIKESDEKFMSSLKKKIRESIQKEESISFDNINEKINEYDLRGLHYEYLSGKIRFSPIKTIILSIFLSIFFILIYALFDNLLNVPLHIPYTNINFVLVNVILMLLFLSSIYYFLASVTYFAISLLD